MNTTTDKLEKHMLAIADLKNAMDNYYDIMASTENGTDLDMFAANMEGMAMLVYDAKVRSR